MMQKSSMPMTAVMAETRITAFLRLQWNLSMALETTASRTETEEVIQSRLRRACEEIQLAPDYNYVVVNEDGKVGECAEEIIRIMAAEKNTPVMKKDVIDNFTLR